MQRYAWPGNIRQLEQALRVAVAMLEPWEREIQVEHLPEDLQAEMSREAAAGPEAAPADVAFSQPSTALREHAQAHARQVLTECQGNVSEAARRLGIGRNTLYRMLR
jgi:transcriptional regulator of acetoin/glycerol metabolism